MSLAIVGMGMISSVGWGVTSSCAAIRAGLTRPRELPYFTALDEEEGLAVPLMGHPVHGYAEGFVSLGRWMRLAQGALEDLLEHGGAEDVLDPSRGTTGLILITPPLLPDRVLEAEGDSGALRSEFLEQLTLHLDLPMLPANTLLVDRGAAGLALALGIAEQRVSSACQRVLIAAVDSYVDVATLDWLASRNRLKSSENPCALSPGEAAVCLLVEPAAHRRSSAPVRAVLRSAAADHEPEHLVAGKTSTGTALARAIRVALDASGQTHRFGGDTLIDLNGELWRAREWSHAQARLCDILDSTTRVVTPASSTGDIGAASGAAAVCLAAHMFARGAATDHRALVVMSSEHGDVGAVVVDAAGP